MNKPHSFPSSCLISFAFYGRREAETGLHGSAIRNHARKRSVAHGCLAGWARHSHGAPSAEVLGRLRPDAALRRLRGYARGVHRGDRPAPRHSGRDFGGDVLIPRRWGRGEHCNPNHPGGCAGGAHGAGRRNPHAGIQRKNESHRFSPTSYSLSVDRLRLRWLNAVSSLTFPDLSRSGSQRNRNQRYSPSRRRMGASCPAPRQPEVRASASLIPVDRPDE
jgi:hypothetical protein